MLKKNYNTKQRDYLVAFFKGNANQCFTAEEVYANAKAAECGKAIGQTTVYRNLERLAQEGILLKHNMPAGISAYFQYLEPCKKEDGHFHLLCSDCGSVIHLDCGFINELAKHMREEHKFSFDKQKTVFYGHCAKCSL